MAALIVGLVGIPAAHADTTMTVTPFTGLSDPADVTVAIAGYTPSAFASLQVAECGNAYANLDSLPAVLTVVPGVPDTKDCEEIGFLSQGTMNTAGPVDVAGLTDANPTVHQTGIGTGDRSCIPSPPALEPCFIYVSTSVNLILTPSSSTDIAFANPYPASSSPATTTTTLTPLGSPVALGKVGHALVQVTTANPALRPDGTVHVFDGATLVGSADLGTDGTVSVALGTLTHDLTDLTATFLGNGSFAGSSDVTPAALLTTAVNNVSIGDASMVEGDSHVLRNMVFPVVLSNPSPSVPVLVNYSIVPGAGANPATIGLVKAAGVQVVAQAKTLTFKAGNPSVKYITVKVYGDTANLGDHTFAVQLSMSPFDTSQYVLRRATGNGLIIDDDNPNVSTPVVSIGQSWVPEGDSGPGSHAMKFAVTLSTAASATVTVPVTVSMGTAVHGNKISGDWSGAINRKVVFRAGQVSKIVAVAAFPNLRSDLDKTVNVTLGAPVSTDTSVTLGSHNTAVGTIMSDE